jgi:hypothetical protein
MSVRQREACCAANEDLLSTSRQVRNGTFFALTFLVVVAGIIVGGSLGGPWPEFLSGAWFVTVFLTRAIWIPRYVRFISETRWGAWLDPFGHFLGPDRHAGFLDGLSFIAFFLGILMLALGAREAFGGPA